jgi:hypothetical protein
VKVLIKKSDMVRLRAIDCQDCLVTMTKKN